MKKVSNLNLFIIYFFFCIAFITSIMLITSANYSFESNIKNTDTNNKELPVVIIDAGHGGEDGGTIGITGVLEKEINLKISFNIYHMLKASGVPTILTRDKDILLYDTTIDYKGRKKALDMAKRLEIATKYENSIFVSIHQNAFGNSKYSGLQVYYSKNNEQSQNLAKNIQELVINSIQPQNNRKQKESQNKIYLLDNIYTPAVLVECGFLSNEKECKLLETDIYQKEISTIIYTAIINFIKNDELQY